MDLILKKIDKRIKARINELENNFSKYNNSTADIRKINIK